MTLSRAAVQEAHDRIRSHIHETPVLTSNLIDHFVSKQIFSAESNDEDVNDSNHGICPIRIAFKCENFQKVGAFKVRGAFNNVLSLSEENAARGVCTHSSGNHAQAVAFAARVRGIPAHIVMPENGALNKKEATISYGANMYYSGSTSNEREALLAKVQKETGAFFIPPYDYDGTILGQGTTGLELEEQARALLSKGTSTQDLDAVVSPLGGGGLLGGLAVALSGQTWNGHKALIYGSEPSFQGADDACRGLASSPPSRIDYVKSLTIADGLRTPVGVKNWQLISDRTKVAGVYSVSEDQIKQALRLLCEKLKIWVEPSAAVPLAVVLFNLDFHKECKRQMLQTSRSAWNIGIVLSGGNVSIDTVATFF